MFTLDPQAPLAGDDVQQLQRAQQAVQQIRRQIAEVIVGQDETVRCVLAALFSQGHTLIIGVPGLAKTLLVKTVARVLGWSFKRVQFTPDMMPADVIGMELLQDDRASGQRSMRFVPGPIFTQLLLADEINRTPPKTQSALLEAMQEYQVTSLGATHSLPQPFIVFATQNPIEQEGTYPLPEAQLDRFQFSLWMDYPMVDEEEQIVLETTSAASKQPEVVVGLQEMLAFQQLVRRGAGARGGLGGGASPSRARRPPTRGACRRRGMSCGTPSP